MSFKDELNAVGKRKDEIAYNKDIERRNKILRDAKSEYENLKKILLDYAKKEGYTQYGNNKFISYEYTPLSPYAKYIYNDGIVREQKLFGGYKARDTGIVSYQPQNSNDWNIYISEITRLGQKDGISISAIIRSDLSNITCAYPTTIKDKRFKIYCGISLKLKCSVQF